MNRIVKGVLITAGVLATLAAGAYLLFMVALAHAFGAFDRTYTKADLIRHYEAKALKITALSTYINSLVPADQAVDIEFEDDHIGIFHVKTNGVYSTNWDVAWDSPKADSLLQQLGWTRQTLTTLQAKLDQVGCISIASGEPCTIGYQRSGMGKFSYTLFSHPMSDSLKTQYLHSCTSIIYKPRVVLEYGGGAVGPQCFPQE
jgi:hypothetical protein